MTTKDGFRFDHNPPRRWGSHAMESRCPPPLCLIKSWSSKYEVGCFMEILVECKQPPPNFSQAGNVLPRISIIVLTHASLSNVPLMPGSPGGCCSYMATRKLLTQCLCYGCRRQYRSTIKQSKATCMSLKSRSKEGELRVGVGWMGCSFLCLTGSQ